MYLFGNSYFETLILKNTFQVIFLFFIISEMLMWIFIKWNNKKNGGNKKNKDRGSYGFIVIGFCSIIFLNPICRKIFLNTIPVLFFWIGSVFMITGVFLRAYSIYTLRKFFTLSVQVNSKQKIIQTGPYKYLRHPAYSGSILSLIGTALCFRSSVGIIVSLVVVIIVYGYRIMVEEKTLEDNFGMIYKEYEKNTNRIIPFIW
ncbi:isoprenylcysteine carboxylmethyltransferase family protein [Clostridium sp. JS66]|uniref:methyltransferase family protein n=1 Tax=Clostridium sp. JS66 TaxID=3064705 RepID=UPI00298DFC4C|nr:isoprenylcysteine carboxylmethyltransferase family protein [Clostridium sp. JS66]WPC44211.1 isoprenylcysteine carboxylmethyltransferase family protein [Clostridium sp. JS66]